MVLFIKLCAINMNTIIYARKSPGYQTKSFMSQVLHSVAFHTPQNYKKVAATLHCKVVTSLSQGCGIVCKVYTTLYMLKLQKNSAKKSTEKYFLSIEPLAWTLPKSLSNYVCHQDGAELNSFQAVHVSISVFTSLQCILLYMYIFTNWIIGVCNTKTAPKFSRILLIDRH